jgi:hypothetical protein
VQQPPSKPEAGAEVNACVASEEGREAPVHAGTSKTYGRRLLVAGPDDLVGSVHVGRRWLGDLEHDRRRAGDLTESSERFTRLLDQSCLDAVRQEEP